LLKIIFIACFFRIPVLNTLNPEVKTDTTGRKESYEYEKDVVTMRFGDFDFGFKTKCNCDCSGGGGGGGGGGGQGCEPRPEPDNEEVGRSSKRSPYIQGLLTMKKSKINYKQPEKKVSTKSGGNEARPLITSVSQAIERLKKEPKDKMVRFISNLIQGFGSATDRDFACECDCLGGGGGGGGGGAR